MLSLLLSILPQSLRCMRILNPWMVIQILWCFHLSAFVPGDGVTHLCLNSKFTFSVDAAFQGDAQGKQLPAFAYFPDENSCHDSLLGCRIGEAQNPGPRAAMNSNLQTTVLNPTALHGKTSEVLELGSDVYCMSETSTTDYVQKILSGEYAKANIKAFWSHPAPDKCLTNDGRPSLRGDALGTAVLSRVNARTYRGDVSQVLFRTCRFSCCVVQMRNIEILVISIYGFPFSTVAVRKQNDLLVSLSYQIACESGLPFLIAGDFNTQVEELPIFSEMQNQGHVELFSWFRKQGTELPPTCKGSTRNDTCILHRVLARRLAEARVEPNPAFDVHSPLTFWLDLDLVIPSSMQWVVPQSWAELDVQPENIQLCYSLSSSRLGSVINQIDSAQSGEDALLEWSQCVETAVDRSLRLQHKMDPLRAPHNGLTDKQKGRCSFVSRSLKENGSVKNDKFGGYNPSSEIFKLKNKQMVKQVRRIKSLIRSMESFQRRSQSEDGLNMMHFAIQWQGEWDKICNAKGFGRNWKSWVLRFPGFDVVPVEVPSLDRLQEFAQLTVFACEASCNQETLLRRNFFRKNSD